MITFDRADKLDILPNQLNNRPSGSILENLTAAYDSGKYSGGAGANSDFMTAQEIWGPILDELKTNGLDVEDPTMFLYTSFLSGDFANHSAYRKTATDIFAKIHENKDTLPSELQNLTLDTINERIKAFSINKQQELQDLADVSPGFDKTIARFFGGIGVGVFDPMTAVTAPFGGWSKTLWKNLLQNAAVNAGAGAISEVAVAEWYKEIGLEYTYEDFLTNVAMQGAFGAALPVAGRGVKITYAQMKKGWKVLSESGGNKPPAMEQALADALDEQETLILENPLEGPMVAQNQKVVAGIENARSALGVEFDATVPILKEVQNKIDSLTNDLSVALDAGDTIKLESVKQQIIANKELRTKIETRRAEIGDELVKLKETEQPESTGPLKSVILGEGIVGTGNGLKVKGSGLVQGITEFGPLVDSLVGRGNKTLTETPKIFDKVQKLNGQDVRVIVAASAARDSVGTSPKGRAGYFSGVVTLPANASKLHIEQATQRALEIHNRSVSAAVIEGRMIPEIDGIEIPEVDFPVDVSPPRSPRADKAELEHENRAATAQTAVDNGQLPAMPDMPESPVSPTTLLDAVDNLDGVLFKFDPRDIQVDAKTFQFKAGGDEFGVGERLQGAVWDDSKSGRISVYEYADGSRFIIDGHQRLGLAKRSLSQNPNQKITLYGDLIKEVDGVSVDQARVRAAMKNIAEGSGTAIDAAKVLRVEPSRLSELPPKSDLVRQAQDMMDMPEAAFMAIINRVIPENYGAIVGRVLKDMPELQEAAIAILAKAGPANVFQAEAIVRQVRSAGGEEIKQIDLFGETAFVESFYNERSKVLDETYKQLRKDKAAFENLTRNADRLEAEGNQLAREANEKRATTDAQTISLLQAVANRKGALSDALTNAAKSARSTGNYAAASREFLTDVRRAIESGDFDRVSNGDVGRPLDGAPSTRPNTPEAEPNLEGFDEATGPAAEAQADQLIQDMFGAPAPERAAPSIVTPEQAAMNDALQQVKSQLEPDWRPYMNMEEGDTLVPLANIVPVKVRPEGVVGALPFMVQAANNEIPKRGALLLKANDDGTFSIRDGNSTYAIAEAAGWTDMPGKIITDEQYNTELSRKAADRILNQDALGKDKLRYVVAEDLGKKEATVFIEQLKDRQPFDNPDDLLTAAAINHDALNNAAQQAADDIGIEFKRAPLKKREKIIDKVSRKYQGNYRKLADAARTGITTKTIAEADAFVKALSEKFHLLDEGWYVTDAGYFDRKIMVIFDDKSLGEIQIWPPKMLNAKEKPTLFEKSGHEYYDISENKNTPANVKADAISKMQKIYGAVQTELDQSFAQKLGFGAPMAKSQSSISASGISMEPSSLTTAFARSSLPPGGAQPLSQIMPSEPSMAAISPKSNLNNLMGPPNSANIDIALAGVKTEMTAAGEQMIIPGAERISDRALAERAMSRPMAGSQSAMPEGGLFDDVRTSDLFDDMDMEIPIGETIDPVTNERVASTITMRDLKTQIDMEDSLIQRLGFCTT
jgi:hypothetical protein